MLAHWIQHDCWMKNTSCWRSIFVVWLVLTAWFPVCYEPPLLSLESLLIISMDSTHTNVDITWFLRSSHAYTWVILARKEETIYIPRTWCFAKELPRSHHQIRFNPLLRTDWGKHAGSSRSQHVQSVSNLNSPGAGKALTICNGPVAHKLLESPQSGLLKVFWPSNPDSPLERVDLDLC